MPSPPLAPDTQSSLATALRLLRERWWVLLACVALGATAFVLNDSRKAKQYEATATLLFGTTGSNVSGILNNAASSVSADPQRDQSTVLLLVVSGSVAERVKRALRYDGPAGDLAAQVSASARPDANLIDVTATDPDPARAARLANAFASEYQAFRRETDQAGLQQGISALNRQYNETPTAATVQRQTLRDSITALLTSRATATGGTQVIDQATPSADPSSPRPKRDALLGAILGLAIGVVLVFAADLLDRRLRGIADFERSYQESALIAVPRQRHAPQDDAERRTALEPYRMLRVSLAQVSRSHRSHVVLVTSAVPGEGKSTTAAGLAQAVAFAGQRVALVELDLRRPTFHQRFDLPRDVIGMSSLLQGRVALERVLTKGLPSAPTLDVIPAGGIPARSAELLSGPYMSHVLRDLAQRYDVVVLDCPPLLPVADTHALLDAEEVDTVVMVGKPYLTTRDQAARARTIMLQHERTRFGLVVNGLKDDDSTYDYEYRSAEPVGTPAS